MGEQGDSLAHLQKSLGPYIRQRQEVSHIRRVLALHLRHTHQPAETAEDGDLRPLALQNTNGHIKSSTSRGLQKDYIKSLRANSKARQEYAKISSELFDHSYTSTSKKHLGASIQGLENPLYNYVFLLKQQQRRERLQVVSEYLGLLDQKQAASNTFLDSKSICEDIEPLPPVPSAVLNDERRTDRVSSTKSIAELTHELEKAVLQAKYQFNAEKRETTECKSNLGGREKAQSRATVKQRLEALGRTRNDMISWMEEQLGKTGDSSPEDAGEARMPQPKTSAATQLNRIQKEYRKYLIRRQELLTALRSMAESSESVQNSEIVEKLQISQDTPETAQRSDLTHPYLVELLSISNEQKSQISQRSHLNTCLAKQQKESMQSMDRLAEESHLLPMYPMKTSKPKRLAERTDSLAGILVGSERPDFNSRARGWVYAGNAAREATRDAILKRVEEGRAAVDESLHTLLGLHQLLGYDMEDAGEDPDEEDIWAAPQSKSPKKRINLDGGDERVQQSRGDIWSRVDGNLGVIRRENE